jgi:sterol 3beta-glucosyltransferase
LKISILCIGSRGDVQPYIALGLGLREAGHDISIVTHQIFEPFVCDSGLRFSPIHSNPLEMLKTKAGQGALDGSTNPLRSRINFARLLFPFIERTLSDCWIACQDSDAILYSALGFYFGPHIAEKLNIPAIPAFLQPFLHPTGAFPSLLFSRNLGSILNRFTWNISDLMCWLPFRSLMNKLRRDVLNLPSVPLRSNYPNLLRKQKTPIVFGFSPRVVSKPPDWGINTHITGYWFLNGSSGWHPTADIVDFLSSEPPPVYVGFSIASMRRPEEITNLVLQAIAKTKQRCLLATDLVDLSQSDLPENVLSVGFVPHDWLFPQVAAVVHHGGAGTTAAGLKAGKPSIIVPSFLDQPFWGRRIAQLGIGPQPIPRNKLSADRLAAAIMSAVSDQEMRERAAAIGTRIREEDGVANAVEVINLCLKR